MAQIGCDRSFSGGRWGVAAVVAWLVSCVAMLAVSICGSCGYEIGDGAVCGHCGAPVPQAPAPPVTAGDPATPEPDPQPAQPVRLGHWDALIAQDMDQARTYYHAGRPEMAVLFCRNAVALNFLSEPGPAREKRSGRLLAMIDACRKGERVTRATCPACKGSGRGVFQAEALSGDTSATSLPGGVCRRCGGRGFIQGRETINEQKFRLAQAATDFRTLQVARTYVVVGNVWVPQADEAGLDIQQRVALKTAVPPVCPDCLGIGREECSACSGTGLQPCDAPGCEEGVVRVVSGGALTRSKLETTKPCPKCRGTGSILCDRCNGAGSVVCHSCNGSGEAKLCNRCAGRGLVPCKHCKATGVYKGTTCAYCQGAGYTECPTCNGFGRRP